MLTIYQLKPKFQNLLRPLVQSMANLGISANQVTWFALFLSAFLGAAIYVTNGAFWALMLLPVGLFIRMALNAIDGMLAREHKMQSKKGSMLNEMTDVFSDTVIYLPFAWLPNAPSKLIIVFVILSILVEMSGVVAQTISQTRRYDGPMGKSDRSFIMGLFSMLLAYEMLTETLATYYFIVALILSLCTLYKRMSKGIK
ncbi:putative CDP-alcohol phosphatidyltransferase [Marinomonas sp. MED121]|uniref:CDP-alcohol phosphatidyltransferase family protein n=1 Tax=Marinomonas sp. MED121 TaxID=314277 RepID=UPI000068FE5D|nr:CDP-alcohol phosphatidyltransferase family protein [Marinomonas sp. MED121]EAQ66638.1 putative CDP-alcohol phosphatidyltransferase [Marinomonas sp. MED121]